MGGMDDIIAEFLAESVENLDQLDQDLVTLEKDPSDREVFARIFRTIHTIKGTCGFLAFGTLESVTHVGESLLSHLRDGTLDLHPEITTDLLALIDAVRAILANIDATGQEGDEGYADLIERLKSHGEDTESTAGIAGAGASTPRSTANPAIRGLINLRGQIITAVDLRTCFQIPDRDRGDSPHTILVLDGGEELLSLVVDRSGDVLEVEDECFEEPPDTLRSESRRLIQGAFKLERSLLLVLDVDQVFDRDAAAEGA